MQKIVFLFLLVALSHSVGFSQNKKLSSSKDKILLEKEAVFYVDVRTPAEFAQGSVPIAVNIPLNQIESRLSTFKGKKKIVVFCKSGSRSRQAKIILEKNGIQNVSNGGTWQEVNATLKNK